MSKILLAVHPKYYGPILEQSVVDELATLGECERIGVDWSKAGTKEYRADFAERIAASDPRSEWRRGRRSGLTGDSAVPEGVCPAYSGS